MRITIKKYPFPDVNILEHILLAVQLILEQHGFELRRYTYTWFFFQYTTCTFQVPAWGRRASG